MKILHLADLHIGQVIYQNYDRTAEHQHFFKQVAQWCKEEKPDAVLICGDIFDIQQPSATVKEMFNTFFAKLQHDNPGMCLIATAGNHDSASRLQADAPLWAGMGAKMVGLAPSADIANQRNDWQDDYIARMNNGYVITMPYTIGNRKETLQQLIDYVTNENTNHLPVVIMAHQTVNTANTEGQKNEIGNVSSQDISDFGTGYDYLALGHIHRSQTINQPIEDENNAESIYPNGVARYCGSALHVSCDEKYPHTVSLVEIAEHGAEVHVKRLRIDELLHFYELPKQSIAKSEEEALNCVKEFINDNNSGYIRLHIQHDVAISSDFDQKVYNIIGDREVRYNPRIVWEGQPATTENTAQQEITVAEIQEINNPLEFITDIAKKDFGFTHEELVNAFKEVEKELDRIREEEKTKSKKKGNEQ